MKTPRTRKIECAECGGVFEEWQGRARFCSQKCSQVVSSRKAREVKRLGIETGILFGKPIQHNFYERYKKSAESKNLEFSITIDQFSELWKRPCSYCDSQIDTIGVDRIDSSKGYIVGNISPCCTKCNLMKRHISVSDFLNHCKKITDKHAHLLDKTLRIFN